MKVDTVKGEVVLDYGSDQYMKYAFIYDVNEDNFSKVNLAHTPVVQSDLSPERIFNSYVEYYAPRKAYEKLKELGIVVSQDNEKLFAAATDMLQALKEAQAALELVGGSQKIKDGDFVPSTVLAYRIVSESIKKATESN